MKNSLLSANGNAPQLVMFDLDGTLVDSVPDLHSAVCAMLNDLGRESASIEQVTSWVGNGAAMLVKRALSKQIEVDQSFDENTFDQAYSLFIQHYQSLNGQQALIYSGAHALISSLKGKGIPIAIITNKPEQFTLPLLKQLKLEVDYVLSGDSLPQKKPDPAPLVHCLAHFAVEAENAVMIGDSVSDISAARAANVPSIAVSYGYNHGQDPTTLDADHIIDSLQTLLEY